jgi:xanthine dehydrogenase small subunit
MDRIASVQIRRRATVGGNLVNASPIGDLAVLCLALGVELSIVREKGRAGTGPAGGGTTPSGGGGNAAAEKRKLALADFFLGYKKLDLRSGEFIETIDFPLPDDASYINFEKVSRRTHLDIASVNSAVRIEAEPGKRSEGVTIKTARLSAGGVAPVPLYLKKTSEGLAGKPVEAGTVLEAAASADGEVSPISDIRGSKTYKRLLLRQLIFVHFITLFPDIIRPEELLMREAG